ncbi:TlpA disulfide reductase family protein [Hydrogenophaga sp. PAMC20947]|uniref:TlpA family protein disulfide reductase n=1 Tax=Hydrogenophaga sp. PAMC20947 TaxID=2565558 RepID=UPI00109DF48E|nr:TlpA disulfide reductase family protein [Hydrogenophaga sp. PAMC20947]QCB46563.1 TlpA family protein disulfide reductase [Hydrogenophaga sp. PAMC20947]
MPHPIAPTPPSPAQPLRRRHLMLGALALACSPQIRAQVGPEGGTTQPTDARPHLQGQTVDGQRLALSDLQGQVVLVFHWSTECAVCRDKMHELRANVAGWARQPFRLLGVNWDPSRQDLVNYEALLRQTVPPLQRLQSIWTGDDHYQSSMDRPAHLPMTYLIDKRGQLIDQYSGRIPPQAWDRIASLL